MITSGGPSPIRRYASSVPDAGTVPVCGAAGDIGWRRVSHSDARTQESPPALVEPTRFGRGCDHLATTALAAFSARKQKLAVSSKADSLAAVKEALRGATGSLAKVLQAESHRRLDEILPPRPQAQELQNDFRLLRALDRLTSAQRDALTFVLFEITEQQRDILESFMRGLQASDTQAAAGEESSP